MARCSSSETPLSKHLENWDKANQLYYGPERDLKNFPEFVFSMLLLVSVLCALAVASSAAPQENPDLRLIFEDEFNEINHDVWQHERTAAGGGNWEFQIYDNNRSNSYVRDGVLYIKPTMTEDKYGEGFLTSGRLDVWGGSDANFCTQNEWWGCERIGNDINLINPISSARMRSSRGFNFRYGRVEVRARMPKGDWMWPAIWMLPQWEEYGGWPASGEIDLVESRGNLDMRDEQGNLMGHQHAGQTMHWGPFWPYNAYERTSGWREDDFGDSFHLYQMEWTEESIIMSIDNEPTFTVTPGENGFWEYGDFQGLEGVDNPWQYGNNMAPFDRKFYFVLNVAVGGTNGFFPDSWTNANGAKPWNNESPQAFKDFWDNRGVWQSTWNGEDAAMAVDYIRVWEN